MNQTHFRDDFNEVVKGQAYGYARAGTGFRLSVTNFDTAGATSLLTTVDDLAKWHANFDAPIVGGQKLISGLLTRGVLNDGQTIDYAFGISHGTYRGVPTVSHGGADAGYRSAFLRFPDQRLGVAVLCNLASANPTLLAQRVADVWLADLLKPVSSAESDSRPEVPVTPELLKSVAGLSWNGFVSRPFVVQDGRLRSVNPPLPLKSLGDGKFVAMTGPSVMVTFELTGGRATRVSIAPPGSPVEELQRAEPFVPAPAALAEFAGTYRSEEIETPYHVVVREGSLRLERLKIPPATLAPIVVDTFSSPLGNIRFVRDGGRITGLGPDGGRIRRMKFTKVSVADQQTAPPQAAADPFLWLEEVDGARAMEWVNAKNAATVAELTKSPLYAPMFDRTKKILDAKDRIAFPQIMNDRIYNFWQDADHQRGLWRRTSMKDYLGGNPVWETVLDIDALAKAEQYTVGVRWCGLPRT